MKLLDDLADSGRCIAYPVGHAGRRPHEVVPFRNGGQGLGELDELGEAANKVTGKAQIE